MRKLALILMAGGGLSLASLSPTPVLAAALHLSAGIGPTIESDVMQIRRCWRNAYGTLVCNRGYGYYRGYPGYGYNPGYGYYGAPYPYYGYGYRRWPW